MITETDYLNKIANTIGILWDYKDTLPEFQGDDKAHLKDHPIILAVRSLEDLLDDFSEVKK